MEINEITKMTGTKLISPDEQDKMPFPVIDRQRVSEKQYHELPNEDEKTNVVFGAKVFRRYERLLYEEEQKLPEVIIQKERELLSRDIAESKKQLTDMIQASKHPYGDEYKLGVNMFFRHAFGNKTIRTDYTQIYQHHYVRVRRLYKAITGKMPSKTGATIQKSTDMLETFPTLVDDIPDDLYHAMLTEHKKRFDEKTQEIRKKLFMYYDNDLRPAVREFTIRHDIDPNMIGTRMDELRKRLSIFFDDSSLLGDTDVLGFTNIIGQVTVDPFRNMDVVIKPTFTHEVIHNLGGNGYRVRKEETPFMDDFEKELGLPEDSGLFAVVPEKSGMQIYRRLRWFNEGVTDMISKRIAPSVIDEFVGSPEEISLIQNIMKRGTKIIPEDTLYQAYFDMKKLFRSISGSFSPGFLMRLDRLIESYGDESSNAIPVINKHFTKIAQILMQNESIDNLIPQSKQILDTAPID